MKIRTTMGIVAAALVAAACASEHGAGTSADAVKPTVVSVSHQDTSAPLRDLAKPMRDFDPPSEAADKENDKRGDEGGRAANVVADPMLKGPVQTASMPSPSQSFDGIGQGFTGPAGTFSVRYNPPDTTGEVGPNHFVQTVNAAFAIFKKDGTPLVGPSAISDLFTGFGGDCENYDDGDPLVQYDPLADRWIISQFAVRGNGNYECIAVSTSPDPTGTYYRYSFQFADFNDYPKMGVWPDAYYFSYNIFPSSGEYGKVCAYDRAKMLAGQTPSAQCFDTDYTGLLPADLDGKAPPPAGAPNYVFALGDTDVAMFRVHVDFANSANSSMTGPTMLGAAPFNAYNGLVDQPGSGEGLPTLSDRLMYRAAYRNFGDHDAVVLNHTVDPGGARMASVRWYEVRGMASSPKVFQQGTYGDSSIERFMGSIAMDASGGIAVGYSASGLHEYPSVRYAGRLAGDPLGVMAQGEASLVEGSGVQDATGPQRWGDYSQMSVDPTDDCTFWYTTEYYKGSGNPNWHTRIGSFRLPNCSGMAKNDFSLTVSPPAQHVNPGQSTTFTVTTAAINGQAQAVTFAATGLPSGVHATFAPAQVTAGGTSTLTISADASALQAAVSVHVVGTSASATHSADVSVSIGASGLLANGGFETGDFSGWTVGSGIQWIRTVSPHAGSYCARVGSLNPYDGDSSISQSITVPGSGHTTLSFWYWAHCPDDISWDQQTVDVRDSSGAVLATIMNVCEDGNAWVQKSFDLTPFAGKKITLRFGVHDDDGPTDPTYLVVDDVAVSVGP